MTKEPRCECGDLRGEHVEGSENCCVADCFCQEFIPELESEVAQDHRGGWADRIMAAIVPQIRAEPKGPLFGPRSEQFPV